MKFQELTKLFYDSLKKTNSDLVKKGKLSKFLIKNGIDKLQVKDFDDEQIWQEIELENRPLIKTFIKEIAKISSRKKKLSIKLKSQKEKTGNNENYAQNVDESTLPNESNSKDRFFDVNELEKFLEIEDRKELGEYQQDSDEEDIDYFQSFSSDEEDNEKRAMYSDFFDSVDYQQAKGTKDDFDLDSNEEIDEEEDLDENEENEENEEYDENEDDMDIDTRDAEYNDAEYDQALGHKIFNNIDSDSDSDSDDDESVINSSEGKSEFEIQQDLLRRQISKLEKSSLKEKSWQLKGEIESEKRPENSLLEEHLQFDHVSKPAPLITEETTQKIEDIIKQRIKNSNWNDVERKIKPVEQPFEYKKRISIDHQKSKSSLAEVYEQEYLKLNQQKATEENPEHQEIKKLMRNLFVQLDAYSNFNFTPKPPQPEVKIINNLPAISVEEITPAGVSDATLLAPQEVFKKTRFDLKDDSERTKTDKKRARRKKKEFQHKKKKIEENKAKKVKKTDLSMTNIEIGDENESNQKSVKSSKEFFSRLQEKIEESKKGKIKTAKKRESINSKKIKL